MKILLTGMTAPHTTQRANTRALSFAGQIVETLSSAGIDTANDLVWQDPELYESAESLDDYDVVIVGVSPITALGATRSYGALSIIGHLYDDPRLRLFVDAPNPSQITHSLKSIVKNHESMLKPFYSNRQFFTEANEPTNRLHIYTTIRKLLTDEWPLTFYPKLPWEQESLEEQLPEGAKGRVSSINLDSVSLRHERTFSLPVEGRWVTDDLKSPWTTATVATLSDPVLPLKRNRFSTDNEVDIELVKSIGVLISPAKKGKTWWSYRYAQAIRLGIPVVTEWRDSGSLGDEWSVLASQIEHMSDARRKDLAAKQKLSYSVAVGNVARAISELKTVLGIKDTK
jgi:hypothetical protein